MRKLALVVLAVVCCVSFIGSVYAAALERGEMVYVRSNLHADGNTILWHNMRLYKTLIPVGTEVKIDRSAGWRTTFVTVDTNKTFRLVADAAAGFSGRLCSRDRREPFGERVRRERF